MTKTGLLLVLLLLVLPFETLSARTIDGSKTPELISDEEAFEVFVWLAYLPDNPTVTDKGFVEAYLNELKLTDVEKESVRSTVQELGHNLIQITNEISTASLEKAKDLYAEREELVRMGLQRHALSLDPWLQHTKSLIRIEEGD